MSNQLQLQDGTQLDPGVVKVMRAIRTVESGSTPDYNAVGDNGDSHGAYQFNKGNWKAWSGEYLGDSNAPMTPENQNKLMYARIKKQKDEGLDPEEIAALHNGAKKGPDGKYTYNRPDYGVKFRKALQDQSNTSFNLPESLTKPAIGSPETDPSKQEDGLGNQLKTRMNDFGTAGNTVGQGITDIAGGNVLSGLGHVGSGLIQGVGSVAGGATDLVNAGLKLIPGVSQAEDYLGKGVTQLANTDTGKSVIGGWNSFAKEHPELAKDIGAVGNIAGAVGLVGGAGELKGAISGTVGKALGKSGLESIVSDVTPEVTGKGLIGQVTKKGTTKSLLSGKIGVPVEAGAEDIAKTLSDTVPNFKKLKTFSEKVNATQDALSNSAETLKNNIIKAGKDVLIPFKEVRSEFNTLETPIAIRGTAFEKQFSDVKNAAMEMIKKSGGTASGMFDARKAFDELVQKTYPHLYDRDYSSMKTAISLIRNKMNDIVEKKLPNSGFKESLRQQSHLYRAIDAMAPKAIKEIGSTRMSRLVQRHPKTMGAAKTLTKGTLHLGLSGAAGAGAAGILGHLFNKD